MTMNDAIKYIKEHEHELHTVSDIELTKVMWACDHVLVDRMWADLEYGPSRTDQPVS